ncbi:hypothetical protein DXV75_05075 [Alteromonas aestuariivivens]|uniref:LRAT domain-containing protein n=1 Tax=Alteromonas aestuariivivens TaxID=1938339 RepID=A0A3D8MBK8_9ALTE|nr:hypothetical protein [Alteromonas aestuariivivens]RDV27406.1 hypothetical protein DXV75_05075 [Alteromonas aestuariivivens]
MALPLVWLGAGLVAAYAGSQLAREQQRQSGHLGHFPGDCKMEVQPKNGSVVCCGIYEVFQHTGIWVDDQIIELKGNGLVRAVSPRRFLADRSGNRIYVACDGNLRPLVDEQAITRSVGQVFSYSEYHVWSNNCHRFVFSCISGKKQPVTRFGELNEKMYRHFGTVVHWQPVPVTK